MESQRAVVQVVNKQGLHARPMSLIVKTASSFQAEVSVTGPQGERADGTSVFQLMGLLAPQGSDLVIEAEGRDAAAALAALVELIEGGFGEP